MQTRALSGQQFLSYEFSKLFLFSEKMIQDGSIEAFLRQNDALDEIDRVGTLDNSASFDAN